MTKDILEDWVYAEQRVKSTFDLELIGHHAKAHMARSLNSRKLIAVVGSGVSQAYGQPNWEQLLRNIAALIRRDMLSIPDGEIKNYYSAVTKRNWTITSAAADDEAVREAKRKIEAHEKDIISLQNDLKKATYVRQIAVDALRETFTAASANEGNEAQKREVKEASDAVSKCVSKIVAAKNTLAELVAKAARVSKKRDSTKSKVSDLTKESFAIRKLRFSKHPHLVSLIDMFMAENLHDPSQPIIDAKEKFTLLFEVCENLFAALHIYKLETRNIQYNSLSYEQKRARRHLRERLKWQIQDERGRIEILLTEPALNFSIDADDKKTHTDYREAIHDCIAYPIEVGVQPGPDADLMAALFALVFYKRVAKLEAVLIASRINGGPAQIGDPEVMHLVNRIRNLRSFNYDDFKFFIPEDAKDKVKDNSIDIISFVHLFDNNIKVTSKQEHDLKYGIDACFISMPPQAKLEYVRAIQKLAGILIQNRPFAEELVRMARTGHQSHLDPIAILHGELGIKRYLTTNYDSEFDKWLESIGYTEVGTPSDHGTQSHIGEDADDPSRSRSIYLDKFNSRAEIIAFEPESVADLFDYGADTRDSRLQILHIHGRIRKKESWLVLSEPDYQVRYAREDNPHVGADEAMRLIFNANPLLFLGLGMTESDILRPLRTFAITEGRLADRPAIALMPALGDDDKSRKDKAILMSRYSVFFMYYGSARVEQRPKMPQDGAYAEKTTCLKDINAFIEALIALLPPCVPTESAWDKAERCAEALEPYFEKGSGGHIRYKIIDVEGSRQHAIDVNTALLTCLSIYEGLKPRRHSAASKPRLMPQRSYTRLDASLTYLLWGARNNIFTSFFCAYLRRLPAQAREWRSQWGVSPSPRERYGQDANTKYRIAYPLGLRKSFPFRAQGEAENRQDVIAVESIRQVMMLRNLEAEEKARDNAPGQLVRHEDVKYWNGDQPVAPQTDRFFAGNPSPALISLRAALNSPGVLKPKRGRRLFILMGDTGVGRGDVFSTLRSPRRFAHLCDWIKLTEPGELKNDLEVYEHTARIPRVFYNFGLSHEIISIFDRLIQFLQNIALNNFDDNEKGRAAAGTLKKKLDAIVANRIQRFSFLMEWVSQKGNLKHCDRIIICINSIDKLFDEYGQAKNSQVARLFAILIDDKYKKAPIDLFFFLEHAKLPAPLCAMSQNSPFLGLTATAASEETIPSYACFYDKTGVVWFSKKLKRPHASCLQAEGVGARKKSRDSKPVTSVYLHRLEPMLPVTFTMRFFPKVALALYYLGRKTKGGAVHLGMSSRDTLINFTHNADRNAVCHLVETKDFHDSEGSNFPAFESDVDAYLNAADNEEPYTLYHKSGKYCRDVRLYLSGEGGETAEFERLLARGCSPNVLRFLRAARVRAVEMDLTRPHKEFYFYDTFEIQRKNRDIFDKVISDTNFNKADTSVFSMPAAEDVTLGIIRWHLMTYRPILSRSAGRPEIFSDIPDSPDELQKLLKKLAVATGAAQRDSRNTWLNHGAFFFERLNSAAGHSRFCLTLVMAAIDDMIERRLNSFPAGLVELNPILRFIERLMLASSGQSRKLRAETIVEQVLMNYKTDTYNSFNSPMNVWPLEFKKAHPGEDIFKAENKVVIYELQENILVALSLIGQPVTAAVLLGVRDVARSFERLLKATGVKNGAGTKGLEEGDTGEGHYGRKRRFFGLFMDLLVHRCLVLRIYPRNNPGIDEYHFTVHSTVRRYFLSKMNAPNVDYSAVDQLTMSMYSSQPTDMPKPTAEGYRRIRKLIDGLSQYENLPYHPFCDPYLDDETDEAKIGAVKRLRLRAAFGALRSFYSINVVSRFSSYVEEGLPAPDYGYFEVHKRRVRWMLRKAYELDDLYQTRSADNLNPELFSFYAEEIAWLFNECGAVSLAQGNIADAVGLLNQARVVAREFIESDGWGSLTARIGLNQAVANIEWGHLREAALHIERIIADKSETPPMVQMASGYRALITSLKGDYATAVDNFDNAINELIKIERFRSAAIFLIHQAETYLHMGKESYKLAESAALKARNLAANGGHEDVRQLSILVHCAFMIKNIGGACTRADKKKIHDTLDGLDSYAKTMGMPRIISEVALLRAQFLMSEGEYHLAANTVQLSLLTATRNNLELTKISALSLLGTAMAKLGMKEARSLLIRARELAIQADYVAEINRIDMAIDG